MSQAAGQKEKPKKQLLFNVSGYAVPGTIVALMGPSGAGKSTLIRCINRLIEPTSGKVLHNGEDVTLMNSRRLRRTRRKMGMIFQEYALVERLTVMENVLSGRLGYVGFWRSYFRKFPQGRQNINFRLFMFFLPPEVLGA